MASINALNRRLDMLESQQPQSTEEPVYLTILEEAEPLLLKALEATEKLYPASEYNYPDVFVLCITSALIRCDKESVDAEVARYAVKLLQERGVAI